MLSRILMDGHAVAARSQREEKDIKRKRKGTLEVKRLIVKNKILKNKGKRIISREKQRPRYGKLQKHFNFAILLMAGHILLRVINPLLNVFIHNCLFGSSPRVLPMRGSHPPKTLGTTVHG